MRNNRTCLCHRRIKVLAIRIRLPVAEQVISVSVSISVSAVVTICSVIKIGICYISTAQSICRIAVCDKYNECCCVTINCHLVCCPERQFPVCATIGAKLIYLTGESRIIICKSLQMVIINCGGEWYQCHFYTRHLPKELISHIVNGGFRPSKACLPIQIITH